MGSLKDMERRIKEEKNQRKSTEDENNRLRSANQNVSQEKEFAIKSSKNLQAEVNMMRTSMSDTQSLIVTKEKECKELEREHERYMSEKDKALKETKRVSAGTLRMKIKN